MLAELPLAVTAPVVPTSWPAPTIEALSRHRRFTARVAHWYQREWGELFPERNWADTFDALLAHDAGEAAGARTWIALDGDAPLGSVTRVEAAVDRLGLHGPWLAGPWVRPEVRGRGVGAALVRRAEQESAAAGFDALHALAFGGAGWLRALGWRSVGAVQWRGRIGERLLRVL
ncbi:MAG: hypothetical protein AMXMBFR36_19080 [Acidobacteriota bacterium]